MKLTFGVNPELNHPDKYFVGACVSVGLYGVGELSYLTGNAVVYF